MSDLIAAYEAALNGRKGEVAQALEACDEHLVRLPNDREAQLYRGALLVLSGRDATLPWTRARLVREGLALMDEALDRSRAAGAPPSLRLLVVRALSNARLPRLLRAPRQLRRTRADGLACAVVGARPGVTVPRPRRCPEGAERHLPGPADRCAID